MKWYVLQFTATRFQTVFKHLENMGVQFYCPMDASKHYRRPDNQIGFRKRPVPLFPGYLFVNVDFGSIHSTKITALPWTQRFISFGGEPVPISEEDLTNVLVFEKGRGKSPSSEQAPEDIVKSIPHELAVVPLEDNPEKRSMLLLRYLDERFRSSVEKTESLSA
ncbi:transcription termination factor NusG [Salmonella enterica]|nr:transcription termination factor NusG [Salmonella enterica]ECV2640888.1 transcription termination factor NusG [Salmonella enterica subsp. enterica serovar Hartford]EGA9323327.1 transcription termination factor NusG [Salmonella enterica]EGC3998469.1 transcription termination factor NusG [Salmonella enterica]EGM2907866.1 transcription termination factor NusG [Salmonella enterica]